MITTLGIITIILMIGYLIYVLSVTPTLKTQTYKMYMAILMTILCFIISISELFDGNISSFFVWIFNTAVWIFNYYINKKHYDSILSNERYWNSEPETKNQIREKKLERILSTNIFSRIYESFINWLKK